MTGRYKGTKRYTVEFGDDTDFPGLQVVLRSASFDAMLDMAESADSLQGMEEGAAPSPEQRDAIRALIERLAPVLASWNVDDDDDQPVPATAEGLRSQDPAMVMAIFTAWFEHVTSVPPPLPKTSGPGQRPEEKALSIPMAPLSRVS